MQLDPGNWKVLNRLLDEALDLPEGERARWLDELDEQEVLKRRLGSLLDHADQSVPLLETLPKFEAGFLPDTVVRSDSETPGSEGETVGAYRLKRLLGEGGMGAVWLADRVDGLLQRSVALKLPRGLWSRPELSGRLAREREILASLDHPNIGRLYDAGLTDDGQPFLALELIEGRPVDEFVRERNLGLSARLQLFLQFARAVAHAHSQLIVHRDIKPSNILVTENEHVRLLDFGIAKLLEDGQAQETEITHLAGRALTLAYASPEQVLGEPIGVGADIYSLGVVLYELLTGARPYKPDRETRGALEDAVLHIEPKRPSDVVEDPSFRRAMRGDLDTILLKALKKLPAERYATVNEFVDDVERFLQGRPVLAQPDSSAYRLRKFVGRNRVGVGAAGIVLFAVIAGAGVALWQARVAVAEKERAEEVKEFVASIFREANPYVGGEESLTPTDLLKNAAVRIREDFDEGSEIRNELLSIVGVSLYRLSEHGLAAELLDDAVSEATERLGADHPTTLHARVSRLKIYRSLGRSDALRAELDLILPSLRRSNADAGDLVDAVEHEAHLAIDQGRYADAEASADEAFALSHETFGDHHATTVAISRLVAVTYRFNGNPEAAEAAEKAYRLNRAFHGSLRHPAVIDARASYALSLADRNRFEEAVEQLVETVETAKSVLGEKSEMVGFFSGRLAQFRQLVGDLPGAMDAAETHRAVLTELAEPDSYTYASTIGGHAVVFLAARQPDAALPQLTLAVDRLESILEPSHEYLIRTKLERVKALAYLGRSRDAEELLSSIEEYFRPDEKLAYANWLGMRGMLARLEGDSTGALGWQQESLLAIRPSRFSERYRAAALGEIGFNRLELGELVGARDAMQEALEVWEKHHPHLSPTRVDLMVGLGRVYLAQGNLREALVFLEKADVFWRGFDADNRWAGETAFWLARCYRELGRFDEFRAAAGRATDILARAQFPGDADLLDELETSVSRVSRSGRQIPD